PERDRRPAVQDPGGPPGHPRGPVPPADVARRAATAVERAARRHVAGRPPPAAGGRRGVRGRRPAAPAGPPRHHRPVAGQRSLRAGVGGDRRPRHVLRRPLVARHGPGHPGPHAAGRPAGDRCLLSGGAAAPRPGPTPSTSRTTPGPRRWGGRRPSPSTCSTSTTGRSPWTWPFWSARRWPSCGGPVPTDRRDGGPATEADPFAVEDEPRSVAPAGPVAGTLSVRRAAAGGRSRASRPVGQRSRWSRRRREVLATRAVVVAAAALGALVEVAPSGAASADRALAAATVAVVAGAGAAARRWTWFVVAGGALVLADGRVATACGVTALALALASTAPVRPAPAVGAAVGGLAGLALLRATDLGFHGSSALATAVLVAPLLASGYRHASRRTRRRVRRAVPALAVLLAVVAAGHLLALARARPAAERGIELLEAGMDAARDGDDDLATERLAAAA